MNKDNMLQSYYICIGKEFHWLDSAYDVPANNDKTRKNHKEESSNRKRLDAEERNKRWEELKRHRNPMLSRKDTWQISWMVKLHHIKWMWISSCHWWANVTEIQSWLAWHLHRPIKKEVVTMEWLKKEVQVGTTNIYDMEKFACNFSK